MSKNNWFGGWFQGKVEKKTEAPIAAEYPGVSNGTPTGDPEETAISAESIKQLYLANSWVRKYTNTIVSGCIRYKLQAIPVEGLEQDKTALVHADEINKLLTNANNYETFTDVREKYLKDFILFGNGALELAPRNKSQCAEMFAAPGYLLRIAYDDNGNLVKAPYHFLDPATGNVDMQTTFDLKSIVHFKLDQLSDRIYGSSPISAIAGELNADARALKDMGRGDFGIPQQVIAFPKTTKTFVDRAMMAIQTMLTNKGGNKVVAVNTEDIKKVNLTDKTFKDDFEFQKWLQQRHNIYGIPPFKLGFVDQVGSMSAREQREEFLLLIETIVSYECEKLSLILCLQRLGYEDVKIVAPLLITRLDFEKARVLDKLVGQGIITPNEARTRYLGLPPAGDKSADKLK